MPYSWNALVYEQTRWLRDVRAGKYEDLGRTQAPGTCGDQFQIIIGASQRRESESGLRVEMASSAVAEASQSLGHATIQI